ncbi:MAG TPA: cob(I)yrinic acid a,c-diamide adenosyltransferase [Anaerolineaceae bacterium]|nr:cob(I)yrinic acid a,c-diamide adenosyltransferase [Anaerolineaceae bacterium]
MNNKKERKGLVIVNTGNGKGKTTAAVGTLFRSYGHGFRICVIQFIKAEEVKCENSQSLYSLLRSMPLPKSKRNEIMIYRFDDSALHLDEMVRFSEIGATAK